MLAQTAQRLAPLLADRAASDAHRAAVKRQLEEDRQQRRHHTQLRAVRGATISGFIRR